MRTLLCLVLAIAPVLLPDPVRAQVAGTADSSEESVPPVSPLRVKSIDVAQPPRTTSPNPSSAVPGTPPTAGPQAGATEEAGRNAPVVAPAAPAGQAAVPLQRSGSLIDRGAVPSAPTAGQRQPTALKPLRQILLSATSLQQAELQRRAMTDLGASIVSRKQLSALGIVLSVFRLPAAADEDAFAEQVRKTLPDAQAESNQRYRLMAQSDARYDARHYAQDMVGLTVPSSCTAPIRLAMLDSGVNTAIAPLQGRAIHFTDVTGAKSLPQQHGTAIASLLLSADPDLPGLVPAASLEAVGIFAVDDNGDPETRTDWVLRGLNHLAGLQPAPLAVNMSFGGNYSALLRAATDTLSGHMLLVAAAGNTGTDEKLYPAAFDTVIAVGAVDANRRRSRYSNFGDHVALYAPGEDIWVSDSRGRGYFASGSSYATPFATAALALLRHRRMDLGNYLKQHKNQQVIDYKGLCAEP